MSKIRISKSGQFAKLDIPAPVKAKIVEVSTDYRLSSFNYTVCNTPRDFVVGEGERYYGIFPDGTSIDFEVQAQHNMGASGLSHAINSSFAMPNQTYLIVVGYYQGYHMSVYKMDYIYITLGDVDKFITRAGQLSFSSDEINIGNPAKEATGQLTTRNIL